ncbi:sigma-70 family RNA polymerase sigma factor [Burkholderia cenocepacia]|uniref:sigma-70 family RNA polymerase sigma factor n=1 Tax=Burkholderia cenocepacia TaxID=95486 RepID=UPI0024B6B14A|nr:sigma-70 family RNA polymerase sigma factor [Burkholderia cenocepacia]MDI9689791.1 sigma-70 family RNA polymerase sigma factor [Burkholderia cenocepacia]
MSISDPPNRPLGEIFIRRRSELRAVAFRIVGRADVVDDVMQDAYVKLLECTCARDVLNPVAYCCQVVRNMALDHCRSRVLESNVIVSLPYDSLPEVADLRHADTGIDERRLLERIEVVLATLPERMRLVFELYRFHEMTQREIGVTIGVSATVVHFMIKDVMQTLALHLDVFNE